MAFKMRVNKCTHLSFRKVSLINSSQSVFTKIFLSFQGLASGVLCGLKFFVCSFPAPANFKSFHLVSESVADIIKTFGMLSYCPQRQTHFLKLCHHLGHISCATSIRHCFTNFPLEYSSNVWAIFYAIMKLILTVFSLLLHTYLKMKWTLAIQLSLQLL